MIHKYKLNGYNIVLDVNSGAVHAVDNLTYDILGFIDDDAFTGILPKDIYSKLPQYSVAEIDESFAEICQLVEEGKLFTEDVFACEPPLAAE